MLHNTTKISGIFHGAIVVTGILNIFLTFWRVFCPQTVHVWFTKTALTLLCLFALASWTTRHAHLLMKAPLDYHLSEHCY